MAAFRSPESYEAGANRFEAPLPVVLNARKAYHLLLKLGADPPLSFGLVFPGKADVLNGNGQWVAQTGSRTLLDSWKWRFNDGFALCFALHEAGDSEPEAWLADLAVFDPNGDEVALSPPFSTLTASYGASVANDVAWMTFKPTKNDPVSVVVYEDGSNQTLTDADAVRGDFQVNLNVGANVVKVRVSRPEALSQGTYAVTITRAAANDDNNDNNDNNQGDSNNAPEFPASSATRDMAAHPANSSPRPAG